jgi:hypothetical protein
VVTLPCHCCNRIVTVVVVKLAFYCSLHYIEVQKFSDVCNSSCLCYLKNGKESLSMVFKTLSMESDLYFRFWLKTHSVQIVKSLETVVFEQYDEIISRDMQVNNLPVLSMVLVWNHIAYSVLPLICCCKNGVCEKLTKLIVPCIRTASDKSLLYIQICTLWSEVSHLVSWSSCSSCSGQEGLTIITVTETVCITL